MALVSLNGVIGWPGLTPATATSVSIGSSTTLDAAGEYVAIIIAAREAMTISHVGWRLTTTTGTPTADVRIETVDASTGLPSGTLWATNTNIVTGALSTGWTLHQLTASASVTAGQVFCVKLLYNSGTTILTSSINGSSQGASGMPYSVINTGTPTKTILSGHPCVLGSSTSTFYQVRNMLPVSGVGGGTFNNTSSAKRASVITMPFGCRVVGFRMALGTTAANFNIQVEDNSGNILSSSDTAYDGDNLMSSTSGSYDCYFDSPVTVAAGSTYRFAVEPTSASTVNFQTFTVPSAAYRQGLPGGTAIAYATYTSGGGWAADTTTDVPVLDILIDQIETGSGGRIIGG